MSQVLTNCQDQQENLSQNNSLHELYLYTLKNSLQNNFYVENEARLAYLTLKLYSSNLPFNEFTLANPQATMPQLLQSIVEAKQKGNSKSLTSKLPNEASNVLDFIVHSAYSNISQQQMDCLHQCLDHIRCNNISGDFLECGIGRGGNAIFLQGYRELVLIKKCTKQVHIFCEYFNQETSFLISLEHK